MNVRFSMGLGLWLAAVVSAAGLTVDEQLRFADGIYLRGFHETAVGEYLSLLRDFPEGAHVPLALFRTGEGYRQMGNQAGADRFYKRVVEEFPHSPHAFRARLRQAELALSGNRPDVAFERLQELDGAALAPDMAATATYYRGLAFQQADRLQEASRAYLDVLARHPESSHAPYAALDLTALHAQDPSMVERMERWFELAVSGAATPAAKAEALYRWGEWAYGQGRHQFAVDTLQALRVEWPGERRAQDALLLLSWSLHELGHHDQAIGTATELFTSSPDPEVAAAALFLRASALRHLGRNRDALADFQAVVQRYPDTRVAPQAAYETMATHFNQGDYAAALHAAPPWLPPELEPDALWMRAESQRLLGQSVAAQASYESYLERFAASSQSPAAMLRLAEMAREAGQWTEAADGFQRMAREHPAHEAAPDSWRAAAFCRLRAGDAEGALADWDELLKSKPGPALAAEARLQKAVLLVDLGRPREAAPLLDRVLKGNPTRELAARAQYWRGVLLAGREEWSGAEAALRHALAGGLESSFESLARLRLVVALQRQQRMDEAAEQVNPLLGQVDLVADNPALVEWAARHRFDQGLYRAAAEAATALATHAREASWRQIGWYWAGASFLMLDQMDAAVDAFGKSIRQQADTREGVESQIALAHLDVQAGRFAGAAERYEAAARAAAGDDAMDLRVRAYFGLGETAEAAGDLSNAARHFMSVAVLFDDPEWSSHALYRAGRLHGEAGRLDEQNAAWTELRQRYPDTGFARQVEGIAP